MEASTIAAGLTFSLLSRDPCLDPQGFRLDIAERGDEMVRGQHETVARDQKTGPEGVDFLLMIGPAPDLARSLQIDQAWPESCRRTSCARTAAPPPITGPKQISLSPD